MNSKKYVDTIVKTGVLISISGMIVSVVIQVFTRFFMDSAPPWTEETARISFVFSVAFGAGLALRDHQYIQLEFLLNKFNPKTKNTIQLAIHGIIMLFGVLISIYSIDFVELGSTETSPTLQIKMDYIFSSMLIMGILIVYYSVGIISGKLKQPQQ